MGKKLQAQGNNIIVKPLESSEQLYGNIVVPDLGDTKALIGEIVSVGPGRTTEFGIKLEVLYKVGTIVHLPPMGPIKIEFEREVFWIAPDNQVLCTIEESE